MIKIINFSNDPTDILITDGNFNIINGLQTAKINISSDKDVVFAELSTIVSEFIKFNSREEFENFQRSLVKKKDYSQIFDDFMNIRETKYIDKKCVDKMEADVTNKVTSKEWKSALSRIQVAKEKLEKADLKKEKYEIDKMTKIKEIDSFKEMFKINARKSEVKGTQLIALLERNDYNNYHFQTFYGTLDELQSDIMSFAFDDNCRIFIKRGADITREEVEKALPSYVFNYEIF